MCVQRYLHACRIIYVHAMLFMCVQHYLHACSIIYVHTVLFMCVQCYLCAFNVVYSELPYKRRLLIVGSLLLTLKLNFHTVR